MSVWSTFCGTVCASTPSVFLTCVPLLSPVFGLHARPLGFTWPVPYAHTHGAVAWNFKNHSAAWRKKSELKRSISAIWFWHFFSSHTTINVHLQYVYYFSNFFFVGFCLSANMWEKEKQGSTAEQSNYFPPSPHSINLDQFHNWLLALNAWLWSGHISKG